MPTDRSPHALAGVVPGALTTAALLLLLRGGGLAWFAAYAIAAVTGVAVTALWGRRVAGPAAATGLAITLTLAYSMLVGVLDAFVLAVAGLP